MKKVMYGASWCAHCRALKELAKLLGYEYIDIDKTEVEGLRVLPTFVFGDKRLEGAETREELLEFDELVEHTVAV